MWEYMKALHQRFRIASKESERLESEAEEAYDKLHDELGEGQRKQLLRFLEAVNSLCYAERLDSFMAGYRLADGVQKELQQLPPYLAKTGGEKERARYWTAVMECMEDSNAPEEDEMM